MGPPGPVEVPWTLPPLPVPLRTGLFLGGVEQCVAWPWARAASLAASASLPPLRPKTKLGHSQTLHALCLSLHHSPSLSPDSFFFFSIIRGHSVPFFFLVTHPISLPCTHPFFSFCSTLQIHVISLFHLLVLFILPPPSMRTAPNLSSMSRVSYKSFQTHTVIVP